MNNPYAPGTSHWKYFEIAAGRGRMALTQVCDEYEQRFCFRPKEESANTTLLRIGELAHVEYRRERGTNMVELAVVGEPAGAVVAVAAEEPDAGYEKPACWEQVLDAVRNAEPVFLHGPTGSGKSTLVQEAAKTLGACFIRVSLSGGMTEEGLIGAMGLVPDHGAMRTEWQDGPATIALRRAMDGQRSVVCFDECDGGRPETLFALHAYLDNQSLTLPTGQVLRGNGKLSIAATANTLGNGEAPGIFVGSEPLNGAFLNRFTGGFYRLDYLPREKEVAVLERAGASPETARALVELANIVRRDAAASRGLRDHALAAVSTRCLKAVARKVARGWRTQDAFEAVSVARLSPDDSEFLLARVNGHLTVKEGA